MNLETYHEDKVLPQTPLRNPLIEILISKSQSVVKENKDKHWSIRSRERDSTMILYVNGDTIPK